LNTDSAAGEDARRTAAGTAALRWTAETARYAVLPQAFDYVEVGEGTDVAVDVSACVGGDGDAADGVDAGSVGGY
jgi:hypothetical protein